MKSASYWIDSLQLLPHPEGGFFRETYRSPEQIPAASLPDRFSEPHSFSTAIYFLLTSKAFSAFHRLKSDEAWHFYAGNSLTLWMIHPDGRLEKIVMGADFETGEIFQLMVPAGVWFAAEVNVPNSYSLVGCTVAPGFEFVDFEMAERKALINNHPQHEKLITRLTRA